MAFVHGKATELFWQGFDVTAFFKSAGTERSKDLADTTAFGNDSRRYVAGLRDGALSAEGMFDSGVLGSDAALRAAMNVALPIVTYWPEGDAAGQQGDGVRGVETAYAITSPLDDVNLVSAELQSTNAIEALVSLLAKVTQAPGAYAAAGLDNGASTALGAVGYLHAFDVGVGGTLDVVIQHSSDGVTWVDLITFTQVTAGTTSAQRIEVAGTVNRHLRARAVIATAPATYHTAVGRQPQ